MIILAAFFLVLGIIALVIHLKAQKKPKNGLLDEDPDYVEIPVDK